MLPYHSIRKLDTFYRNKTNGQAHLAEGVRVWQVSLLKKKILNKELLLLIVRYNWSHTTIVASYLKHITETDVEAHVLYLFLFEMG